MNQKILVIGATGLLGQPVAQCLKNNGSVVRILTRDAVKTAKLFGNDFEIVEGNVDNVASIEKALDSCFGVHINLSGDIEQTGVENVSYVASKLKIQRISYISGTSVSRETTWVPVMNRKYKAEQAIRASGVSYCIFCPTWFMEVLPKYVRGNSAIVFGTQPNPYRFIAATDYARMVAASYRLEGTIQKRFILHGPEGLLFHEAVKRYCAACHPDIQKVTTMPYWLATIISRLIGRKEMKTVSDFMAAFQKTGELGDPTEANSVVGAPEITFEDWLQFRKSQQNI